MEGSSDDPAELTSAELARRLATGSRDGATARFHELYERLAPSLWAWARLRIRPELSGPHEVEDFLQEVWLRAIENLPRFDPDRSGFRAWIFGIAKNVAYEQWRRGTAATEPVGQTASAILDGWPQVATSIRTRLAKDEGLQLFLDHAEKLDPIDRMLLVHCGLEDLSCAQAGRRLGLGEEAATKRWQRLRSRLREDRCSELLDG